MRRREQNRPFNIFQKIVPNNFVVKPESNFISELSNCAINVSQDTRSPSLIRHEDFWRRKQFYSFSVLLFEISNQFFCSICFLQLLLSVFVAPELDVQLIALSVLGLDAMVGIDGSKNATGHNNGLGT